VSDLFVDSLEFEWVDFFHFGGNHDGYDSDYMELAGVQTLSFLFKVAVHDLHGSKVGLRLELIRCNDLNHPVQHSRPEPIVNFMLIQKPSHSLRIGITVEHLCTIEQAISLRVILGQFSLMKIGMLGPLGGGVVLELSFEELMVERTVKVGFLVTVLVVILLLVEGLAVADWILHSAV
jgi:hypothetical protein